MSSGQIAVCSDGKWSEVAGINPRASDPENCFRFPSISGAFLPVPEVGIIVLGVDRTGAAADITNINMIIGSGVNVKPDCLREEFTLTDNEQNNIHNHVTIHCSQQLCHQLKHHLKILPPITFILPDHDEDDDKRKAPFIPPLLLPRPKLFDDFSSYDDFESFSSIQMKSKMICFFLGDVMISFNGRFTCIQGIFVLVVML